MKLFLAIPALLSLVACAELPGLQMSGISAATPVALTSRQIGQIKAVVANDLYDGDHAHFRNIRAADVTLSGGTVVRRVCGEVAGVNPVGGYGLYAVFGGRLVNGFYQDDTYPRPCELR